MSKFKKWGIGLGIVGLLVGGVFVFSPPRPKELPVFMYHDVADPAYDVWVVSVDDFRLQMKDLYEAGYRTIHPRQLWQYTLRFWPFRHRKPMILTFDDGLLHVATNAEPILKEYGFQAICYLIMRNVADTPETRGKHREEECFTWPEVKEAMKRGTLSFGSHSFSHSPNPKQQAKEAGLCRWLFRQKTGERIFEYCYPHGQGFNPIASNAMREARYRTAFVCKDKVFEPRYGSDLFTVPRVSVYGGINPEKQDSFGYFTSWKTAKKTIEE